jgi:hypothetical protein
MRIYSEDEFFEMLLERATAIYQGMTIEREKCAKICETYAGPAGLTSAETRREALLNAAALIRDPRR